MIARLFTTAHQSVAFQGGEKRPTGPVNQFQVIVAAVPGVEEQRACLDFAFRYDVREQGLEMLAFGELVLFRGVNAVIQGQKIADRAAAVHEINQADIRHQAVRGPGVRALGYFNEAAVALVLHAVVHK